MKRFIRISLFIILALVGAFSGWQLGQFLNTNFSIPLNPNLVNGLAASVCGTIGIALAPILAQAMFLLGSWLVRAAHQMSLGDVILGFTGLILGLLVAYLINLAADVERIPIVGVYVPAVLAVLSAYIGLTLFLSRREEFSSILAGGGIFSRSRERSRRTDHRFLLDTNVIIDGRIADVLKSGILDGTVIIPSFVLAELQYVADSTDPIRRARGRRGLEVLNRIQKESPVKIDLLEVKSSGDPVDQRLLKLGKSLGASLITNDFNLAQIARLQSLPIINLNDLANALKPVVLPGEEITITVIKEGKESDQGVGYLDDGTMVVIEDGKQLIGETVNAMVTSILQTSAGRMIFGRKHEHS